MNAPILTDDLIASVLTQTEQEICPAGDARCVALPYTVEQALATLDGDGWVTIGWVTANSGRQTWDVQYHVDTGDVRSRPAPA